MAVDDGFGGVSESAIDEMRRRSGSHVFYYSSYKIGCQVATTGIDSTWL